MKLRLKKFRDKAMAIMGLVLIGFGIYSLFMPRIPALLPVMLILFGIINIISAYYRDRVDRK